MTHANTRPPEPAGNTAADASRVDGRRLYPVPAGQAGDVTGLPGALPADLVARMAAQVDQARAWLPPVDPTVFDCYLGTLATAVDPYTEADPIGVLVSLLSSCGVHIGPEAHLPLGMERHPLTVWPLLIGHTGSGKKGTAWNAAKSLLTAADPEFVAANVHSGLSSGEGLAAVFATDDGSKGGKAARLLPDGDLRLLAYEPEWAATMARMKREGNTLSATLRAAWEGGNLSTLNVDARVARRGHVGIVAHITPGEFRAKVSASDMAGGTYNRFLPIAVGQSKFLHLPTTPAPELLADLGTTLAARLHQAGDVTAVAFAPGTENLWAALYLEFAGGPTGPGAEQLSEFTSRAAPYCLRVAALYAALDGSHLIQPGHLAAAAALIRYSLASAAAVLRPGDHLARLAAWIAEAGEQGRTRKEITTDYFKNRPPKDADDLLTQLTNTGDVTVTQRERPGGGRRPTIYTAADPAKFANFRT